MLRIALYLPFAVAITSVRAFGEQPSPAAVAEQVDAALAEELFVGDVSLAPRTDDATFLRRAWLDIAGDIPTPEDVIAFLLDPSEDKRGRAVRRLLAKPSYGANWARYWRDVIFYRRIEDRALIAVNALESDLTDQLNANVPWDQIAADFITATGDVREKGATAIIMAQDGRTEEVTAEVSRIFLGTQLQCAQCHDHPYDRWKREQFHELAAFFPRLGVRNMNTATRRTFVVYANDRPFGRNRGNNNNGRPMPEHRMPDLEDPSAPGQRMQPKFFLTGDELDLGLTDAQRRLQLAAWLTESEWFAIALVNRMWSELVGEGFYEPVDDLGPDRTASAPRAAKILAAGFADSNYDLKWLIETICTTKAYHREARPRRGPGETPMTANVSQPLRADQLYNALLSAFDVAEPTSSRGRRRPGLRGEGRPRTAFNLVFGYDPSDSRETVAGTIPQALALMNSQEVAKLIRAEGETTLARLVKQIPADDALLTELYLRILSRQPTEAERTKLRAYIEEIGTRREAIEDVAWALINSAEFQFRR